MKKQTLDYVKGVIDNEGFDYAFMDYSEFEDVKDEEFHRLRRAYKLAHRQLMKYIETNSGE